ncbi:primosomal protein N' [Flavobacteriales bacterium]|nr:primosomal protein N' [Flavobacteriales bacterium]
MLVEVILPVPVPNLFSYSVNPFQENEVTVGKRVVVQFGKSKLYTGLVRRIKTEEEKVYGQLKEVLEVLDDSPIVSENQLSFWEWIADYYMCTIGEVMIAALPAGLKLQSESNLVLTETDFNALQLTDREFLICEALSIQHKLSIKDASDILGLKTVQPIIKSLISKGAVVLEEELKGKFKDKKEKYVRISESITSDKLANEVCENLSRSPAQMTLFLNFLSLKSSLEDLQSFSISKKGLKKRFKCTDSVYKSLLTKGLLLEFEETVSRLENAQIDKSLLELSNDQEFALQGIESTFKEKDVILFHGVTGSGKTEVYVRLIKEQLDQGKQVLYLLPEIALTTQLINRLQKYFGTRVGVYHSRYNNHQQVEVWNAVMNEDEEHPKYDIILGARSSMFLPYRNLGLVIVDEEHETSFKQFDPAPRYHARDAAIVLAKQFNSKVLLGSATPSVESYYNAKKGRYGYVPLTKRYGDIKLPEVQCADIQREQKKRLMKGHFSSLLIEAMKESFARNEQVILFQNKRGFAPMQECQVCAHIPQCKRCDVSLTYHKHFNELRCHYCGYHEKLKITCSHCGSIDLKLKGFGTEKIEEEMATLFPEIKVMRMDLDTTRTKDAYKNIIQDFEEHNIDVLVGTQMVTKGLDFDNVGLVGIMNADNLLGWPDFRAHERAYHLMSQVSGRAGRKKKRGKVIIQSYNPEHSIIRDVMDHRYENMYANEILQRKNFEYPPFFRMVQLTIVHQNVDLVNAGSAFLVEKLKAIFGSKRVLGPEFPYVSRIKNKYHKQIVLKIDKQYKLSQTKGALKNEIQMFLSNEHFRSLRVIVNVDPM